jgi:hypothetical protein
MKPSQLATLVLRLMGIYCLVLLIPMAGLLNSVFIYSQNSSSGVGVATVVIALLVSVGWLAVGILLIVFSRPLGDMLSPVTGDEGKITAVSIEQVQVLAFAVAGVLIFAEALPQLLNYIVVFLHYLIQLKQENSYPHARWPLNRFGYAAAIGTVLKAALGLWLFFGARGFANFWRSMRNFGTPKPPP